MFPRITDADLIKFGLTFFSLFIWIILLSIKIYASVKNNEFISWWWVNSPIIFIIFGLPFILKLVSKFININ